ncbi:WxL domain-containing protein [Paenibacillus agricola]|uniref:WxL domain-containing protein n=1 Tax=Paenibacillus agricola TaxID=2716264 RepID=A0ABX0JD08_9BACL|nr:WxL domain-containing protein [Paenibacillus agricola]NHN33136.1 hypothetical protein [Paenibacillus agricola]
MKKKIISSLLASIIFAAATTTVFADTTSQISTSFTGGSLSVTPETLVLPAAVISASTVVTTEKNIHPLINDSRGTGGGWSLSIAVSDFESVALPDKTNSAGGSTMTVGFSSGYLDASVWSVYRNADAGQAEDATHGPKKVGDSLVTLGTGPTQMIVADAGYGMGEYQTDINFILRLPKSGKVKTLSAPGTSNYSVGSDVGLLDGSYTATFTYTLGTGI